MKRISSRMTFFFKRVFPCLWFGMLAIFFVAMLVSGEIKKEPALLVFPVFMGGIGFAVMKLLVFDLVDEVYDLGDELLIRNHGIEERVQLRNIINVNFIQLSNPPRITLSLRAACRLGQEITFSPAGVSGRVSFINPFAKHPIVQELIERADRARSK